MSYNIPHYPEQPIKDFDERYKDLSEPRRSYAKMISTTDHYIGQVIDKLKKHDLLDNTLIVFMSDNGHSVERYHIKTDNHKSGLPKGHRYGALGGGGNTGKWVGHKGRFTEGGIRVPAIISFPKKMPRSIVRDQIVSAADIMPTVLDYCAVPLPKVKLDGQSLRSIMTNNKATHHKEIHWMWGKKWATRQGSWKLLGQYQNGKNVIRQLYSLEGDKPEQKNYLKEKPELAQKLFALHKKWYEETKRP